MCEYAKIIDDIFFQQKSEPILISSNYSWEFQEIQAKLFLSE